MDLLRESNQRGPIRDSLIDAMAPMKCLKKKKTTKYRDVSSAGESLREGDGI